MSNGPGIAVFRDGGIEISDDHQALVEVWDALQKAIANAGFAIVPGIPSGLPSVNWPVATPLGLVDLAQRLGCSVVYATSSVLTIAESSDAQPGGAEGAETGAGTGGTEDAVDPDLVNRVGQLKEASVGVVYGGVLHLWAATAPWWLAARRRTEAQPQHWDTSRAASVGQGPAWTWDGAGRPGGAHGPSGDMARGQVHRHDELAGLDVDDPGAFRDAGTEGVGRGADDGVARPGRTPGGGSVAARFAQAMRPVLDAGWPEAIAKDPRYYALANSATRRTVVPQLLIELGYDLNDPVQADMARKVAAETHRLADTLVVDARRRVEDDMLASIGQLAAMCAERQPAWYRLPVRSREAYAKHVLKERYGIAPPPVINLVARHTA